jgi:CheY-like chemotaxis protein
MQSDVIKVRQTLLNLLSNAAKFTSGGTVTLEAARLTIAGNDWLRFSVIDTGIGMSAAQLEIIFREFTQADASTTRRYGGTGLGLTISKRLSELLGGDIEVDSVPGEGTAFTVMLPAALEPSVPPGEAVDVVGVQRVLRAAQEVGVVLVIDDDPLARDLIARSLVREGFAVETAADGDDGLRKMRALRPDVVTLDVMMPGIDGWSVLTAMKSDPELAEIPVVMLTLVDDKNRGIALGAADYLTKPIDRLRLVNLLKRYRRDLQVTGAARVLVIEDNPDTREIIARALHGEGWQVALAGDGRAALQHMTGAMPDIILLDLMMPEMDGFAFITAMRQVQAWAEIPVIVITAKDLTAAERAALNGSVQSILTKHGAEVQRLLREIQRLIREHAQRVRAGQAGGERGDDSAD